MASIIEESLTLRGVQPYASARDIVAKARAQSGLDSGQATTLAIEETRQFREGD